jgi:outer membrane protein assembly factor BamB
MRHFTGAMAALFLASAAGMAQESRVYTRPSVPSRDTLDRLHLKMAWRAYIPVGDRHDGIFTVQFAGDEVIVQTRAGFVASLNAADGTRRWRKQIGVASEVSHGVGFNAESIFVARNGKVHALDRLTGRQQWEYDVGSAIAAPVAADDVNMYVSMGVGRLQVYQLPNHKKPAEAGKPAAAADKTPTTQTQTETKDSTENAPRGPYRNTVGPYASGRADTGLVTGPHPEVLWEYKGSGRLEQAPILTDTLMVLISTDGSFLVSNKFQRQIPFQFKAAAGMAAPLGQYAWRNDKGVLEDVVYIPSQDFNLYALDVVRGAILWRFTGAAAIHQKPAVTDEDVYVVADRVGLSRINRTTGRTIWQNRSAERFLASNPKFVYAVDRAGRLLILDRARGTEHATLDTRAFNVPVANEATDRLYLAANDGVLVCLYDRDYPEPFVMKTPPAPKPPEKPMGDKPEEKADDNKDDKKPDKKPDKADKKPEKDDKKADKDDKKPDKDGKKPEKKDKDQDK